MASAEKEKMLKGELYFAGDPLLTEERDRAHELCFKYNKTKMDNFRVEPGVLHAIFKDMGVKYPDDAPPYVEPNFFCDYGYNITLGRNFYANYNNIFLDCAPISIGDNCFFAPNVQLYTPNHPLDIRVRGDVNSGLEYALPIKIGNNCWLGGGVIVLPGVTIGNGVTVGAGSVVTRDVPDNVVVVGNPAKIVKRLDDTPDQA